MGSVDKAKQAGEQPHAKLDEAQEEFNERRHAGEQQSGRVVEYDRHGRPIPQAEEEIASPPHGDPLAD